MKESKQQFKYGFNEGITSKHDEKLKNFDFTTVFLSTVSSCIHPFKATFNSFYNGYFNGDIAPCSKAEII